MKKLVKSWALWFILLGIAVLIYNLTGRDDKNIVMIGLNPLLSTVFNTSEFCIAAEQYPYVWHVLSMLSMVMYGLVLDGVMYAWKKNLSAAWYLFAAVLTMGFWMKLARDYVLYTAAFGSAPFYLWAAVDALMFLLLAGAAALIGRKKKRA